MAPSFWQILLVLVIILILFGAGKLPVVIPEEVEVRVHDSTADLRYMVLPMRPEGAENLNPEELAGLVTRDSMIGVAILNPLRKK